MLQIVSHVLARTVPTLCLSHILLKKYGNTEQTGEFDGGFEENLRAEWKLDIFFLKQTLRPVIKGPSKIFAHGRHVWVTIDALQ